MHNISSDFNLFAKGQGVSSLAFEGFERQYSYINPTIIEERRLNVAPMDVFSRLMMDRIIFLGCPIDDTVGNIIQAQLLYLSSVDSKADISMYINSPGGYVSAGLGILDTMNIISPDVSTVCTGSAASMAAVLLSCGAKGKRLALPHSKVMIHQPLGGAHGQASDIIIEAKEILRTKEELINILRDASGQSYEKILSDTDRNYWMNAPEAIEYGLVDRILSSH